MRHSTSLRGKHNPLLFQHPQHPRLKTRPPGRNLIETHLLRRKISRCGNSLKSLWVAPTRPSRQFMTQGVDAVCFRMSLLPRRCSSHWLFVMHATAPLAGGPVSLAPSLCGEWSLLRREVASIVSLVPKVILLLSGVRQSWDSDWNCSVLKLPFSCYPMTRLVSG